jgi:hypothetical protein
MADTAGGESLLFLTDEQLRKGIEAMFFAYRGFTADPDRILEKMDYGRAHHRAIHFIHRSPGTTVNNLLSILGVTKQSLNRVLRTLIEDGLVRSAVGKADATRAAPVSDRQGTDAGTRTVGCAAGADAGGLSRGGAGGGAGLSSGAGGDDGPRAAPPVQPPEGGRLMSQPNAHLLIVDDDERIRGLLQKFLMRNGFWSRRA